MTEGDGMKMGDWDAYFLGRKFIEGTATSSRMALLVCSVVERSEPKNRLPKYKVACTKEAGIRLCPLSAHTDQAFESDPDTKSRTNGNDSNQVSKIRQPKFEAPRTEESYPVGDVAFCHTDRLFPKILVVAVKSDRLRAGLEAVVLQFRREDRLREICRKYNELRRRVKLDSTGARAARNAEKRRLRPAADPPPATPLNLLRRTDDDGVTHIEVSGGDESRRTARPGPRTPGILSISTPDASHPSTSPDDDIPRVECVVVADCPPRRPARGRYLKKGQEKEQLVEREKPAEPERKEAARRSRPTRLIETSAPRPASLSDRFLGKLRELAAAARRPDRKGERPRPRPPATPTDLKSVIKSQYSRGHNNKRVTFSAFATVQVVD
ncbi:hypothetical protein AAG570_012946 [Ranatra chinensis]|uniref:Uncharacterized protein n=1 Tax=Ranatra chinensis TaxID=642074 RepID=A0ABD0YXS9_9HEMI